MSKTFTIAALGLAAAIAGAAGAQAPTNDRRLTIYGSDRCPANTICVRAPESERYRIPKTIRENTDGGEERWGSRASGLAGAGAAGTGSCTNTGGGGWTGCWGQQMRQARAERKAKKEEDATPQR